MIRTRTEMGNEVCRATGGDLGERARVLSIRELWWNHALMCLVTPSEPSRCLLRLSHAPRKHPCPIARTRAGRWSCPDGHQSPRTMRSTSRRAIHRRCPVRLPTRIFLRPMRTRRSPSVSRRTRFRHCTASTPRQCSRLVTRRIRRGIPRALAIQRRPKQKRRCVFEKWLQCSL